MDQRKPQGKAGQGVVHLHACSLLRAAKAAVITVGLLGAGLASADGPDNGLTGVWAGSIGEKTVMVCFTHRGPEPGFGLFYDRSKPTVSMLTPNGSSAAGNGSVASSWGENGGTWSLQPVDAEQLTGQWTQPGSSPAMIALTRIPASNERDRSTPCASRTFNEPTESQPLISAGPTVQTDGLSYRILTLNAGRADEQATASGLHIDTLEILSDSPAAQRLNALLRQRLPLSSADVLNRLYSCRRRERDTDGQEGVSTDRVTDVRLVKGRWLTVQTDDNSNCAAPRTASWVNHYTWDLQTGQVVDLMRWFKNAPATDNPDGLPPGEYAQQLPASLKALVLAGLSPDKLQACPALANPEAGYIPHLSEDGIRFSFPGSGQGSCANEALLPFSSLQPLLSDEGRNQLRPVLASHVPGLRSTASR